MGETERNQPVADDGKKSGEHDTGAADDSKANPPREIGGREGPDPVRYGDWEKAGRCIDF